MTLSTAGHFLLPIFCFCLVCSWGAITVPHSASSMAIVHVITTSLLWQPCFLHVRPGRRCQLSEIRFCKSQVCLAMQTEDVELRQEERKEQAGATHWAVDLDTPLLRAWYRRWRCPPRFLGPGRLREQPTESEKQLLLLQKVPDVGETA